MDRRLVNVAVATVWTSHDSPREIDWNAVTNPVDIPAWLHRLTYETRLGLCNDHLVQSQVLYGQEVIVTEEAKGWVHVIVPEQPSSKNPLGYPGWIPMVQLAQCPNEWNIHDGPVAVVAKPKAALHTNADMELSYQTILPLAGEDGQNVMVKTPDGSQGRLDRKDVTISESLDSRHKGTGLDIVSCGEQFIGLPYLWGGMSSYGYDCSGFSYSMCKANGYIIPRDAHDQAKSGKEVDIASDLQPGDLVFFAYEEGKGKIHHVGIYYGDGKLLHSPNTGKTIEIIPLAGTIYEKELCAARRYWLETEA